VSHNSLGVTVGMQSKYAAIGVPKVGQQKRTAGFERNTIGPQV